MLHGSGAGTGQQGWLQRVRARSCRGTVDSTGARGSRVKAGEVGGIVGGQNTELWSSSQSHVRQGQTLK